MTAVAITAALLALAIVLVRSGRGMWLLLVAALPLIPIELAPGVWAPSPVNSAAYALIFPPGALQPDTVWAWMEASLQSFAVILPALVIGRLLPVPRARMWAGDVLPRFSVPAAAGIVYLGWKLALGAPVDWGTDSRAALLVTVGGLVVTGIRNRPVGLLALAVTTALAGSLVTWTTDVTGHAAVVTDLAVWRTATLALLGAAWVLGQPYLAAAARGTYGIWRSALHAQAAGEDQGAQVPATDPDEVRPDAEVRLSLRPSPGAAAPAGGRHRA